MSLYRCPKCFQKLTINVHQYQCVNHHSYDISKKGYVNLMLANQGHHLLEGDNKEMIESRTRFLESKKYDILKNKLLEIISPLTNVSSSLCDVACGEGYYTTYIHQELIKKYPNLTTYGVDISKFAINKSCSRKNIVHANNLYYAIGNLDYLPYLDQSFDVLLNCFAPINEKEFNRILKNHGYYIRVLPGIYHLYELKEVLYDQVNLNIPKDNQMEGFLFVKEIEINDVITLNNQEIKDLFTMTPYYYKTSYEAKKKLENLQTLKTRISFIIKIYQKKSNESSVE
jgi:23S rRNA (guanine745-N1)-methyltransferase